jgi:hypothetical protein
MNNNSKLQKSSSIFIVAILVAGVIAIASPSIAFAQGNDDYYKKHDYYDPYKKEKKHGGPTWNSAYCDNGNIYINAFKQKQVQKETERNVPGSTLLNDQPVALLQTLDELSNINKLLEFNGNVILICINAGNENNPVLIGQRQNLPIID